MFNTLFSGIDMVGLSGTLMTSAANTSVYVSRGVLWKTSCKVAGLQLHVRDGSSLQPHGKGGAPDNERTDWLERWKWYLLSWGLSQQHVWLDGCSLPSVPR